MRSARGDVRDHIAYQKNNHGASYRPRGALQRSRGREIIFREIFEAIRFPTFATLSANNGPRYVPPMAAPLYGHPRIE
jgi:hypothetical protein